MKEILNYVGVCPECEGLSAWISNTCPAEEQPPWP